jgi:hypothetical protein
LLERVYFPALGADKFIEGLEVAGQAVVLGEAGRAHTTPLRLYAMGFRLGLAPLLSMATAM